MTHREDPNRGVFDADCEFCGTRTRCQLVMSGDGYLWKCLDVRECAVQPIDRMDPKGELAKPEAL